MKRAHYIIFFFFSSRRRHTRSKRDWSSDVCSSDLWRRRAQAAEVSTELIAKAKQEGQVVYYTDLIVDQIVRPLTAAFEAKYGIKTAFVRGDSQVNSIKLLNEYRAGRVMA